MFRNYLKVSWRHIARNKGFSITNIIGLTVGMTCTMLILLWVQDELNWDHVHRNHGDIYQVMVNRNFNGEVTTDNAIPFPLIEAIKNSLPGVKNAVIDDLGQDHVLTYNNTVLRKRMFTVNNGYFNTFHWKVLKGSLADAMGSPDHLTITASLATALFGSEDPINKMLLLDNSNQVKVAAVIADPPANSTFQFNGILPYNYSSDFVKGAAMDWVNCFSEGFLEVAPGTDLKKLEAGITSIATSHMNKRKQNYFLFPMDKWRLYSEFRDGVNVGGMIEYVRLFSVIAFIILAIACVNFMNLSTAKSEKRAREVGIRKTLGSERSQLLMQFYSESFLFSLMAFMLSVGFVYLLLPSFNLLVHKQLSLPASAPLFYVCALLIIGFTTLFAGSYPALYLSSFSPVKVLKGTFLPGKAAVLPRRVLVVLQFVISIFLISATILVYQQLQHARSRNVGYNPNNLISIPSSPDANKNGEIIKNELLKSGLVASVTRTSAPITDIWNFSPAPDWKGKPGNTDIIMSAIGVDAGFASTIGTKLLSGRDFTDLPGDSSGMILNKAAVDKMQLKDPVGTLVHYGQKDYTIIGVTQNVVMASPYREVMPMLTFYRPKGAAFFVIRLKAGVQPRTALDKVESVFKRYNPAYPFEYQFVDEQFNAKFVNEDLVNHLTHVFAGLAIFICCLGLSGLTVFTVERRFKEIGVRKVLGASVQQLLLLISREFLLLVFLAFLITIPLSWWLLNAWLAHFEYRTNLSPWLFIMSGLGILILTLLVVSLNALRAARANPVKSLRSE